MISQALRAARGAPSRYWGGMAAACTGLIAHNQSTTTSLESAKAYDHDPRDFDYYVKNPTVDDLPVLLHKFDEENQEVWPWIWTHPNGNGPHHVFVVTAESSGQSIQEKLIQRIVELRKESPQNNILIVISNPDDAILRQAAKEAGLEDAIDYSHCGVVTNVDVQLLNSHHKILMLDDERVIAYDHLTIC